MGYPIIFIPFLKVNGLTLFPFIFIRDKQLLADKNLLRHEYIHIRQQLELLVVPFYLLYLGNYLINMIKFKDHDLAYRQILFEREAYLNEGDEKYLKNRKPWAWRYF